MSAACIHDVRYLQSLAHLIFALVLALYLVVDTGYTSTKFTKKHLEDYSHLKITNAGKILQLKRGEISVTGLTSEDGSSSPKDSIVTCSSSGQESFGDERQQLNNNTHPNLDQDYDRSEDESTGIKEGKKLF